MRPTGDLVYSNDLCAAFLTAIVGSFRTHHDNAYLGRTAIQKLTYFAKILGVPVPCSFGIYTYGPYSDQVTFAMESLLADDVVQDESPNPRYSSYTPGPNATELLSEFEEDVRPHEETINRVVRTLGSLPPNSLELVSTLHFIARRQVQTRRYSTRESVIAEFKSVKHDKFDDFEITTCYDALSNAGLA